MIYRKGVSTMTQLTNKKPTDIMIWIGKSYKSILCEEEVSCGMPITKDRNKCYVHEAEWRGCCRKVPRIPTWAIPGKTKIFLVHRDGFKSEAKGKIFGYFVLDRIEVIGPAGINLPLEINERKRLQLRRWRNKLIVQADFKGTVYCRNTSKPIKDAKIILRPKQEKKELRTTTNENGKYKILLTPGKFDVNISAKDYKSVSVKNIDLLPDENNKHDFYLTPDWLFNGTTLKKTCWNGKKIVTHIYKDGRWKAINSKCSEMPEPEDQPECKNGNKITQECWDGTKIVTHICKNGEWEPTGEECPEFPEPPDEPDNNGNHININWRSINIPIDNSMFETHRSCSLRFRPRGVYLVDALTANISDRFNEVLHKGNIYTKYNKATSDAGRKKIIEEGNKIFKDIMSDFHKSRKSKTKIPSSLNGNAKLRGELVLFNNTYIYKHKPRAAFLGLRRIDGSQLLEQITKVVSKPKIH